MGQDSHFDTEPLFRSHQTTSADARHRACLFAGRWHNYQHGLLPPFEFVSAHGGSFTQIYHRRRPLGSIQVRSPFRPIRPLVFTLLLGPNGSLAQRPKYPHSLYRPRNSFGSIFSSRAPPIGGSFTPALRL